MAPGVIKAIGMSAIVFRIQDKRLIVTDRDNQNHVVDFIWSIAEVRPIRSVLVVMLEPDPGACYNENVFGLNEDAKIIWQIPPRRHVSQDSPYTGLSVSDAELTAYNWSGRQLTIDPSTGAVLSETIGK